MDRDKIESILKEHGVLLKSQYRGLAKELSKIMNNNESIKAVFLTDGGWWVLMSRRIIILTSSFWSGFNVDEIITHGQIERLYYNIDKGLFSSSMELKMKLKKEKTRTYKVNNSMSFDYVAKAIDNLKYTKSKIKKKKS